MAYKQAPPLSLRVGAIQHELDARSDGTPAGHRQVIMRDLGRYYRLLDSIRQHNPEPPKESFIRDCLLEMGNREDDGPPVGALWDARDYAVLDALERAHILVTHHNYDLDFALREVGLVK